MLGAGHIEKLCIIFDKDLNYTVTSHKRQFLMAKKVLEHQYQMKI